MPFFQKRAFGFYFRAAVAFLISLGNFLGLLKFSSDVLWLFRFPSGSFFSLIICFSDSHVRGTGFLLTIQRVPDNHTGLSVCEGESCWWRNALWNHAEPTFPKLEPENFSRCPFTTPFPRHPAQAPTWGWSLSSEDAPPLLAPWELSRGSQLKALPLGPSL